ncbi:hypothetical protein [Brevibacillus porteri]|uniref:Phage protein n=1 Tax=Brevibacillus porteri TaxID=2126350 RepID=A0ABX5FS99_9BACL|nr:hypothetical protein [Brevibacillus porteri]MED1801823.1 hypothetical protein [Brevibacillus porteri]MED2134954.1 hypothetical protein [Brevibacillus porteri]MED2745476.1 hypothetical protein [Brevibacillus porteri]MED2815778.1 hypothetical protein [Brevibacillus porteri]MED2897616.1 hypothetical protein [Brevibacillus porteri]
MIKEALQYVAGLANTRLEHVGDQVFSTQKLYVVDQPTPANILVRSLSGIVEYLQSEFDWTEKLMIHVKSPTEVEVFSTFNRDFQRNVLIKAEAMLPTFRFDHFFDTEHFNIKLQSMFVPNDDRATLLKLVGNIKEDSVKEFGDDGISQTVTAKTGVATVGEVLVPNPVVLMPFRTFVEVDQPASNFVFRMQKGPTCALFEADGGAWKLEAMKNIKEYLGAALAAEIKGGKLYIIA